MRIRAGRLAVAFIVALWIPCHEARGQTISASPGIVVYLEDHANVPAYVLVKLVLGRKVWMAWKLDLGTPKRSRQQYFTQGAVAADHRSRTRTLSVLFALLAATGLRIGETAGLHLESADPQGIAGVRLDSWTAHGGLNIHNALSYGLSLLAPTGVRIVR